MVCPRCRGPLVSSGNQLSCRPCSQSYPVIAGVVDLRVAPDPWIGLEADRAKANRIVHLAQGLSFADTVRLYWDITPTTEAAVAGRFIAHVLGAAERTREWLGLDASSPTPGEAWLDLGCGTADVAASAPPGVEVVGIDVAMRWLVIAKKRLEEGGKRALLVCANAEALPFQPGVFDRVLSLGLFEHCAAPGPIAAMAADVMRSGAEFRARTVNRFSLLPEPHVGLWGVGFLPRGTANRYVRWRTGLSYDHHRPCSAGELRRALAAAPMSKVRVEPAAALQTEVASGGGLLRRAAPFYEVARKMPILRSGLRIGAPLLEVRGVTD